MKTIELTEQELITLSTMLGYVPAIDALVRVGHKEEVIDGIHEKVLKMMDWDKPIYWR